MPSIPFVGAAYESISPQFSSQTCINLYPVVPKQEDMTKFHSALFATPGKTEFVNLNGSSVRQLYATVNFLYAVVDNQFYEISIDVNNVVQYTNRGTLNTSSGRCSMTSNFTQIAIVDTSTSVYCYDTQTHLFTINTIPDGNTASRITFQDAYGIFTIDDGTQFQITNASDFTTMSALDRGSVSSSAEINNLVAVETHNLELWMFGTVVTEIWRNAGTTPFPYARADGTFIEMGCAARWSIEVMDNAVIWLARDIRGRSFVCRSDGYRASIISTEALHTIFETYSNVTRSFSYSYTEAGHTFYVLTFPDNDATWVYDVSTGLWHRRTSWDPIFYRTHRDLSNCYAFFNNMHIVGDFQTGKLYNMSIDIFDEVSNPIYRERTFPTISNDEMYLQFDRVQIVVQSGNGLNTGQGSDPKINLQTSRDGKWGNKLAKSAGKVGERSKRVKWERCGTARNFIFRVSMTDPIRWCLLDTRADYSVGVS